ncbi:MAG TPA: phosphoribosyltransferase family protein [Silvibacterium sp.]|nr:phosphoribosyltransferase family protein [Silvibacterium sp.]
MIFIDREDAGRQLANQLRAYANSADAVVLGIPRGGVPVAFEIAHALHLPLDIFLSRKLGVPGQEELAFGAVAAGDGRFLDQEIIDAAGISSAQIERITQATRATLEERAVLYRGNRPPLQVEGRTVILVDDGIATGASIYAAIRALRQMKPRKLIIAAPVAPMSTSKWLRSVADECVVLFTPANFYAVGQFYRHFSQVSDEEVISLLRRAERSLSMETVAQDCPGTDPAGVDQREVSIMVGNARLAGTLCLPENPRGLVLFAHGSGSSRHSPRNRYVAEVLQRKGLATLLFDLLTSEEESIDRRTAELRFSIGFLAQRLVEVTQWVSRAATTRDLPIGYFGASTGAAAALVAAARLPTLIDTVVSRGGRPDLAADVLGEVRAATLLIVGGLDQTVITLNYRALAKLKCRNKELVIIPGATHLFEESGTLEQVAQAAAEWFVQYLGRGGSSEGKEMAPEQPDELRSKPEADLAETLTSPRTRA